jgi:ATP/maltotriose-dependent transcriptional regulator MalT
MVKTRWNALGNAGQMAANQGHTESARAYFEQAAEVAEIVDGPEAAQMVLGDLGEIAVIEGHYDTAEALYRRALDAARTLQSKEGEALCLSHLAQIAGLQGDLARAWNEGLEALEAARALEWDDLEYAMLTVVGEVARDRNDFEESRRIFNDALGMARKFENRQSLMYALYGLALVDLAEDEPVQAAPLLREALALGDEFGAEADVVDNIEATARVAEALGTPGLACRLASAADAFRSSSGLPRPARAERDFAQLVEAATPQCGEEFDAWWSEGAAWTLAEAAAAAVEFLSGVT